MTKKSALFNEDIQENDEDVLHVQCEKEKMKDILKAQLNLNLSHSPCKNDTNKSQH